MWLRLDMGMSMELEMGLGMEFGMEQNLGMGLEVSMGMWLEMDITISSPIRISLNVLLEIRFFFILLQCVMDEVFYTFGQNGTDSNRPITVSITAIPFRGNRLDIGQFAIFRI